MKYYFMMTLCVISWAGLAQTSTGAGDWETDGNWSTGTAPSGNIDNQTITIGVGTITRNGDIRFNSNSNGDLVVNDYLVITGSLIWSSNSNNAGLSVNDTLVIQGDLELENNAGSNINIDIAASGVLIVQGNLTVDNSALNGVDVSSGGTLVVGGDFDTGSGSNITNNGSIYAGSTSGSSSVTGSGGAIDDLTDLSTDDPDLCAVADACSAILPVTLIDFTGTWQGDDLILTWRTASEQDNDYFTLEHSGDGLSFNELDQIPGQGTTYATQQYKYTLSPYAESDQFFRLKQTDYDGTEEYVGYLRVRTPGTSYDYFSIYPNLVSYGDLMEVNNPVLRWVIYDINGKVLQTGDEASIDVQLPKGSYFVSLENLVLREVKRVIVLD